MGNSVHSWNSIIMKAFIFATILAVATAIPIEDTPEVKAAKEAFAAAFAQAEAGDHADLATAPVATAYLADEAEVADAKAAFKATFDAYAAGEIPLPVAPVHNVVPVVNAPAPVAAPVLAAPHLYNGYYGAGYPGYAGYAGYPYGYPVVAPAAPAATE